MLGDARTSCPCGRSSAAPRPSAEKELLGASHRNVEESSLLGEILVGARHEPMLESRENCRLDGKSLRGGHGHDPHALALGLCAIFAEWCDLTKVALELLAWLHELVDAEQDVAQLCRRGRSCRASGGCEHPLAPSVLWLIRYGVCVDPGEGFGDQVPTAVSRGLGAVRESLLVGLQQRRAELLPLSSCLVEHGVDEALADAGLR